VPDDKVAHIHIPNSVPLVYKIDPLTGKALQQDSFRSSASKGHWLLCAENQERLVDKLGVDSESFARSLFAAWDDDGDGYIPKDELANLLIKWKKDRNPAINALAGKILEEVCNLGHRNIHFCESLLQLTSLIIAPFIWLTYLIFFVFLHSYPKDECGPVNRPNQHRTIPIFGSLWQSETQPPIFYGRKFVVFDIGR
jgi:Ca2+-binding EF-hand superfamily protein